ncbi:MAG: pyridoxal phosphate-dependent aminotransferase, partial [Planctomycetes bacterium]|nr:pyridoxal phosphate-dependent aminotransferase [Planctomycetota bacterium]
LHNPTLASIPPALLRELIAISAANNTYVLVDEVYLDHLKPGAHDPTCLHYGENVIATSSLTKVYGLGTLRFGWCLAPSNVIERILELQDLVDPELPAICQNLGVRALVNMERLRKRTRAAHERGLPVIKQWAASRKDITLFEAQGGVTAAIKIRGVADSWKLAEHLAYKHRVTVAPGAAFGMDSWLRVNIGKEPEELRRALDTLGKGIDAFVSK